MAVEDAEREKKVLEIDIQKEILRKEGEKNLSNLQNTIVRDREQSLADVENYKKTKQAEANKILYTEQFVQLEMARSLANNTKFYFSGENSALGSLMAKVLGNA